MNIGENKISVVFRITGSAADIAEISPNLIALKGDVVFRPPTVPSSAAPEAWWAVEVIAYDQESTETVISEILDRVEILQIDISEIVNDSRFKVELDCAVEIEKDRPVLEASSRTLQRLGKLNAALGFEVHDYRE